MHTYFSCRNIFGAFMIFVFLLTITGCCPESDYPCNRVKVDPPERAKTYLALSDSLKLKRETTLQKLSKMEDKELYERLQKESLAGRESFNSLAFKEFVQRDKKSTEALYNYMIADNRTSFLGILALRKMDSTLYKRLESSFVLSNLVKTLEQSESFNSWGLPHLYWEDAAKILIEKGTSAISYLKPLLKNTKPAPVWGSEESMEYKKYQYRICDYAMALILEIKGEKLPIPVEIEKRDKIIQSLINDK